MKKNAVALLAVLLFGGCADSEKQSPTSQVPAAATGQELAARSTTAESVSDKTEASSSVDAAMLLASTLADANAADKRVLVHLGAPW